MQYQTLGHLPRAPLVYSLAMIEYAAVPKMAEYAPVIMENLRGQYPDIKAFNSPSLKIEIDAATGESSAHQQMIKQWRMNNPESTLGLVFGEDRLIVHTTAYEHFNSFSDNIREITDIVSCSAKIKYAKNLGIRQIDNIMPIDQLGLSQLIKPGYHFPPQTNGLTPLNSRVEFVYQSDQGQLYIRAYQLFHHPKVPQDLFGMANELINPDTDLMAPVAETFILADTDHVYTPDKLEPFDLDRITSKLDSLHQQCSLGFREMVTQDALSAWKKS